MPPLAPYWPDHPVARDEYANYLEAIQLMDRYAGTDELDRMGGLARRAPWLAALFLVAALSLAGLPPLSGFFGKFVLFREAVRSGPSRRGAG